MGFLGKVRVATFQPRLCATGLFHLGQSGQRGLLGRCAKQQNDPIRVAKSINFFSAAGLLVSGPVQGICMISAFFC